MSAPRTADEAAALPEFAPTPDNPFGGLVAGGITGDSIILFRDKDGRSMTVIETKDGFAKKEFSL